MASQLEYFKKSLGEVLAKEASPDNPFVQGLRAQIAMHEKPRAENPMDNGSVHLARRGDDRDGT